MRNNTWKQLKILILSTNALRRFAQNSAWINLEELDLRANAIEDQGAILNSSNEIWEEREKINIAENKIGEEGGAGIPREINYKRKQTRR